MDSEYDLDFEEGSSTPTSKSNKSSANQSKISEKISDNSMKNASSYEIDFAEEDFSFLEEKDERKGGEKMTEKEEEIEEKEEEEDMDFSYDLEDDFESTSSPGPKSSTITSEKKAAEVDDGTKKDATAKKVVQAKEENENNSNKKDILEQKQEKEKIKKGKKEKSPKSTNVNVKIEEGEDERYTPDFGNTPVSSPKTQAKEGLSAQKMKTEETSTTLKAKRIENKRITDALKRRIGELEGAINNSNDPNNPMLLKIKNRKQIVTKRDFLEGNNRKLDSELENYAEQEEQLLKIVDEIEKKIEKKREDDEANIKDHELESQTFEASKDTVSVGEENLILSHKIQKAKLELTDLECDITYAKNLLKQTIGRKELQRRLGENGKKMEELTVYDLLTIYVSIIEEEKELRRNDERELQRAKALAKAASKSNISKSSSSVEVDDPEEIERKQTIRELERRIHRLQEENVEMENASNALCLELQISLSAWEDVEALKAKVTGMKERWHQEKKNRIRAQQTRREVGKKLHVLGDHIEKLLKFIKSEAVSRAKADHWDKKAHRELNALKDLSIELQATTKNRDKTITSLHHGTKLLEDQLRLTDGRYLLLREKLDYAKTSSVEEIRRANLDVNDVKGRYETIACVCKTMANGIKDFDIHAIRTIASKLNIVHKQKGKAAFLFEKPAGVGTAGTMKSQTRVMTSHTFDTTDTDETCNTHDLFDDNHGYDLGPESYSPHSHHHMEGGVVETGAGEFLHSAGDNANKAKEKRWLMPEYPDLGALIYAEDPDSKPSAIESAEEADSNPLWSSTKIESIQKLLKDYGKTPIRDAKGSPCRVLRSHSIQESSSSKNQED